MGSFELGSGVSAFMYGQCHLEGTLCQYNYATDEDIAGIMLTRSAYGKMIVFGECCVCCVFCPCVDPTTRASPASCSLAPPKVRLTTNATQKYAHLGGNGSLCVFCSFLLLVAFVALLPYGMSTLVVLLYNSQLLNISVFAQARCGGSSGSSPPSTAGNIHLRYAVSFCCLFMLTNACIHAYICSIYALAH